MPTPWSGWPERSPTCPTKMSPANWAPTLPERQAQTVTLKVESLFSLRPPSPTRINRSRSKEQTAMDSSVQRSVLTPAIKGNKLELLRRRLRTTIDGLSIEAIRPVERTQPLRLSFAQERLWFLDRLGLVG